MPKEKKDSTAVAKFLEDNAKNPDLFGEEIEFNKEKSLGRDSHRTGSRL
jgi:hypothetical protein